MKAIFNGLCLTLLLSTNVSATVWNTSHGQLTGYGDVEFNVDAMNSPGELSSLGLNTDQTRRQDINGRILLGLDGIQHRDNRAFVGFSAQPLASLQDGMTLDDAKFFFGKTSQWKIQLGRYEAWDMFPIHQDTFVEYAGNSANDLYKDGSGYVYMMKEGRGRTHHGGGFQLSRYVGHMTLELNTLIEDGTCLYADGQYHGNKLTNKKNVIYLRPVVNWTSGHFSLSLGLETNVIHDAYGYYGARHQWLDQSRRTGFGGSLGWNSLGQGNESEEAVIINLNLAGMNATDETDQSVAVNVGWHNIELGYVYAHNKIDHFNTSGTDSSGEYHIHTLHTSYRWKNILGFENFDLYTAAYYSLLEQQWDAMPSAPSHHEGRYGVRARFKYYF
ncbi:carbohydrate porin [Celerinatantimonas sp. YJH-8]|uniref:carbohydrate porin n=1 Tax=Celerinatantimonas sp. YJH-8 TaxID=3228714 RepID=UPI0038CB4D81